MTHVSCDSKLCSIVRSSMHSCPENWVAIRCAVVHYAWSAHAFSAGIKCRHCIRYIEKYITTSKKSKIVVCSFWIEWDEFIFKKSVR